MQLFLFQALQSLISGGLEIAFVIKLITFVYILYWLFITFNQVKTLFAITSVVAAYFIFFHSISSIFLVIMFFIFVVFGNILQMLLQFSILPLLGLQIWGTKIEKIPAQANIQEIEQKAMAGKATHEELEFLQQQNMAQQYQFGYRRR